MKLWSLRLPKIQKISLLWFATLRNIYLQIFHSSTVAHLRGFMLAFSMKVLFLPHNISFRPSTVPVGNRFFIDWMLFFAVDSRNCRRCNSNFFVQCASFSYLIEIDLKNLLTSMIFLETSWPTVQFVISIWNALQRLRAEASKMNQLMFVCEAWLEDDTRHFVAVMKCHDSPHHYSVYGRKTFDLW